MDREFRIGDKYFILKEQNNKVRIFLADKNRNPYVELALIPYEDLNEKNYLSYDIEPAFINTINSFNDMYPVESVSNAEKIIVTRDHDLYLLVKNNNRFGVYPLGTNDVKSLYDGNNYNYLLNKLLQGEALNFDNYILSRETFYNILSNPKIIDSIIGENAKNMVYSLVELYKQIFGNQEKNVGDGGSSSENAKVKVRKAGFANKMFMICLSCFSFGVIIALIIVLLNRYVL